MRPLIWLVAVCRLGFLFPPGLMVMSGAEQDALLIVPHTHWEGAVFKTREEYLDMGLPHILDALNLLKRYPGYRFVLDQMCYVKPFLDRYPGEAAGFRELLAQHRLEIAGGTDSMHDNNIPSGESIVRQYLIGKWFFRDRLGYDVKTGWGLDTFGHNAQMPQILRLAGMESYWFQRGVPGPKTPAEFFWQGLDGAKIPAFWLPLGYSGLPDPPSTLSEFERSVRSRYEALTPFSRGYGRVLMAGADVHQPDEKLPPMVAELKSSGSLPFSLDFGLPSDYEALIAKNRPDRPTIGGELNPVFQGVYSTRIEIKQWMREAERLLTSAEKASVLSQHAGSADREELENVWEPVLFHQAHDLSSGVMLDPVYADAVSNYEQARRRGSAILDARLNDLAAGIDTAGPGKALVVFNLLGWPRSDLAEIEAGFTEPEVREVSLLDGTGKPVPLQIIDATRDHTGSLRTARIAFVARDIPAMGYAVYHLVPNGTPAAGLSAASSRGNSWHEDEGVIENEFYKATFDLWTGDMSSLTLKQTNAQVLAGHGNVIAREQDGGDFWELYGILNGARLTAMTKKVPGPRPGFTEFSNDNIGGTSHTGSGPVYAEFRIRHPLGKNQFATRVRMYAGIRRIDIHTELQNEEELVRYRVLFPTTVNNGHNTQEIAFGAMERPRDQEFPAQNWMDYGTGSLGLALLNRGLPGNNVAGDTMLLSLLRSTRLLSYGVGGGYELGTSSDTALELGKRIGFDYALVPHTGTWQEAAIYRSGLEFNNPLLVRQVSTHPGSLSKVWGLVDIANPQVVLSALKPARNGEIALRIYEATGHEAQGIKMRFGRRLLAAREANLIEDPGKQIQVQDNGFDANLHGFEIKTFLLRFAASEAR